MEYKACSYYLVYSDSTTPKEPRMRKKIYYVMDAHTKTIISHALVLYDYLYDGCLPNLKVFQYKPINRSDFPILNQNGYDVPGENDKFPFKMPAETATDGACRFELLERQQLATPLLGQSMRFGRTTWVSKPQSSETSTNHR